MPNYGTFGREILLIVRLTVDKEKLIKQALAFLIQYIRIKCRARPLEVKYNIARALQYLGMNSDATQIYQ